MHMLMCLNFEELKGLFPIQAMQRSMYLVADVVNRRKTIVADVVRIGLQGIDVKTCHYTTLK